MCPTNKRKANNLGNAFSLKKNFRNVLIQEIFFLIHKETRTDNDIPAKILEAIRTYLLHF